MQSHVLLLLLALGVLDGGYGEATPVSVVRPAFPNIVVSQGRTPTITIRNGLSP